MHYVNMHFALSTEIGNKGVEFLRAILKHHVSIHHVSNMACKYKCEKSSEFSILLILGLKDF